MKKFQAKHICASCGSECVITYVADGTHEYADSCECVGSFSPCEGVPDINQWLINIHLADDFPETLDTFSLNTENLSLVEGMVYIEYKDRYGNTYKAITNREELKFGDSDFIEIQFSAPGCGDTVECVSNADEAIETLKDYCLTHYC